MEVNQTRGEASFKNDDELLITYPANIKSAKDKKNMKEDIMKKYPEVLISDYKGPDDNKVLCNLLFFTQYPTAWHTTLCAAWKCVRKGGISKGRQITLQGAMDFKLTVNLYHNGTVMVQGSEVSLTQFQRKFKEIKSNTLKHKKDPEIETTDNSSGAETSSNSQNRQQDPTTVISNDICLKTYDSPGTKGLRDTLVELEQDYITFKEETNNNLLQLQSQMSHPSMDVVGQLCLAVKQLEEANQELRQEVRTLKEELLRREWHRPGARGHPLDYRSRELSDKNTIPSDGNTESAHVPVPPALPPQASEQEAYPEPQKKEELSRRKWHSQGPWGQPLDRRSRELSDKSTILSGDITDSAHVPVPPALPPQASQHEGNQEQRKEEELLMKERHRQGPRGYPLNCKDRKLRNSVDVPVPPASPQDLQPHLHHQSSSHCCPASSSSNISHGQKGMKPAAITNNIFILCDSNGNHLDQKRLFPRSHAKKLWCPTTQAAQDILQKGIQNPSHIIIHTGTNDFSARKTDVAEALIGIVKSATQKYPDTKVIISSLLPRRDTPKSVIDQINAKLLSFCAGIPNVKIAHHNNITVNHLYDNVHIHLEGMKLFAKTLKDTALNRERRLGLSSVNSAIIPDGQSSVQAHRPPYAAAVSNRDTDLSQIRSMLRLICDSLLN